MNNKWQFKIEDGYLSISYKDKELLITHRNDYAQLFGKWNWYTFTFIQLRFENDYQLGGFEFDFTILGVGVYLRFNYKETEKLKELMKEAKELEDSLK